MVAVASEEGTKAGDGGVVVLKNEAYDNTDGHLGVSEISGNVIPKNKGQYTLKQYFLGSRVPTWLTYVLPGDLFFLYEEAWNAFPDCITILTSKFMSNKKARISVRTLFFDEDSGVKENAHNLTASELAERKVFNLNIAEQDQTDKEYQKEYDPALCKSEKSGRGPLAKDWVEKSEPPVMCCYKLVRVDFKVWGLQGKTENLVAQSQKKLFLKTHGQVFAQLDNYFDMKMSDIREMEDNAQKQLQDMKDAAEKAKAAAADDAKKPAAKS